MRRAAYVLLLALSAGQAQSAGFAIREQSASAFGNAFAGSTAAAEDISYMYFNPAGIVRHSGNQAVVIGSYIAPHSEFNPGSASTLSPLDVAITGGNGGSDIASNGFIPAAYALWDVSDRFKAGLGINVPFALRTEYDDGWIGRYHALDSEILSIIVNPAAAYRITDQISLGAGISIQYVTAELSNAIDFGTIGFVSGVPGAVPTQQDGHVALDGNDLALGFNVGVLFEPWRGTRVGASYRSKIAHTLEGDADFTLDSGGVGAVIAGATGRFVDSTAEARLTTPDTVRIGFHHDISETWSVMGEAAWTNWTRFDELRVQFANPAEPDNVVEQDWTGSWFFAAGASHRPVKAWTLRAGIALDQTPIPDNRRTPRIPGDVRTWLTVGATYAPLDNIDVSMGYAHLFVPSAPINLSASSPGNQFRGNLQGDSNNYVNIFTIQAYMTF